MNRSESGKLGALKTSKVQKERRLKRIEKYDGDPNHCSKCEVKLSYDKRHNKFCSRSCSASINNKGIRRNGKPPKQCKKCGKKLDRNIKQYCNTKCHKDYQWEKLKALIRTGQYASVWSGNAAIKRFLVEENGGLEKCYRCKLGKWMGKPIPLNAHHKDGDATNNFPCNLELLCLNCHGLTDNFGSKNKNGTRKYRYRRKRYNEGKSY